MPQTQKTLKEIRAEVQQRLRLEIEVERDGYALKREGKHFVCPCPFHSEKTASFKIRDDEQTFKCFGCLPGDALISTPKGIQKIKHLGIGDDVIDAAGYPTKIIATQIIKNKQTLRLITKIDKKGFVATSDHKMLTLQSPICGHGEWRLKRDLRLREIQLKDLTVGSWVPLAIQKFPHENKSIELRLDARYEKTVSLKITPMFSWVVGMFCADGSTAGLQKGIRCIQYSVNQEKKVSLLKNLEFALNDEAGLDVKIVEQKLKKNSVLGANITICHAGLARWLREHCGHNCENKTMPNIFRECTKEVQASWLAGLMFGDGTRWYPSLCVTSQSLIYEAHRISLMCGAIPAMWQEREKENRKRSYSMGWRYNSWDDVLSVSKGAKPRLNRRHKDVCHTTVLIEGYEAPQQILATKVLSIKTERMEEFVYDITTEHSHTFATPTISVHNCNKGGDVLDWIAFVLKKETTGGDFVEVLREACKRAGMDFPERGATCGLPVQSTSVNTQQDLKAVSTINATIGNGQSTKIVNGSAKASKTHTVYATTEILKQAVQYNAGKGKLAHIHLYRKNGVLVLIIFRIHIPNEDGTRSKSFRQATRCEGGWCLSNTLEKNPLYRHDEIIKAETVIIVEGELKADALMKLGFPATCNAGGANAVGRTDWTPLAGKKVIVWRDNDDSGKQHEAAVLAECLKNRPRNALRRVKVDELGLGPKGDVINYLCLYTNPDVYKEAIEWATQVNIERCGAIAALEQEHEEAKTGKRFWAPLVWPKISAAMKPMRPGGIAVLAGSPGVSKSFVLIQNLKFWEEKGYEPLALMMEDGATYHLGRALAQVSGNSEINDYEWIKNNPEEAARTLAQHSDYLERIAHCIAEPPYKQIPTVDWMLSWIEQSAKDGHKVLAIDPLTAMLKGGKGGPQEDERFIWGAKEILKEYGTRLFWTTHPRKQQNGKPVAPSMDEMAGGASYSRFVQVIMYLWGNSKKNKVVVNLGVGCEEVNSNRTIQILKTRDGWGSGQRFAFIWEKLQLEELGKIE